mmetsp:Transcript_89706/g.249183  ORF Transcript_89706/g.249183 Transcript_89706/m.249183 type:complete len:289 (-) Transcript_89706:69-935(-)
MQRQGRWHWEQPLEGGRSGVGRVPRRPPCCRRSRRFDARRPPDAAAAAAAGAGVPGLAVQLAGAVCPGHARGAARQAFRREGNTSRRRAASLRAGLGGRFVLRERLDLVGAGGRPPHLARAAAQDLASDAARSCGRRQDRHWRDGLHGGARGARALRPRRRRRPVARQVLLEEELLGVRVLQPAHETADLPVLHRERPDGVVVHRRPPGEHRQRRLAHHGFLREPLLPGRLQGLRERLVDQALDPAKKPLLVALEVLLQDPGSSGARVIHAGGAGARWRLAFHSGVPH